MEHLGESERQGFCVGDILVSCSSERGTHVIKPTADATLHATMLMNNATKPMVFKVLRALNPEGKSLIQPEKEKTPLNLSHDETIARAIHSFQEIDVDKKGWLTKNETRLAYCDALGGVDVADDEFELEYLKMQQGNMGYFLWCVGSNCWSEMLTVVYLAMVACLIVGRSQWYHIHGGI